ncbi:hypothetical protein BUE80_DR013627 [Diplocarpon rosae]|nr:hypothetical protein BUE80_DR013627 [Diplocarpon rosae]
MLPILLLPRAAITITSSQPKSFHTFQLTSPITYTPPNLRFTSAAVPHLRSSTQVPLDIMKTFTLATIIISALAQIGAAQDSQYSVSCQKRIFGGIPDSKAQSDAGANVCTNGLDCEGLSTTYDLTNSEDFGFACYGCPTDLDPYTVDGCQAYPA